MSCKGCAYAVLLGGKWYCDYLMITGRWLYGAAGERFARERECVYAAEGVGYGGGA